MNNVDILVKLNKELGVYDVAIQIKNGGIIFDDFGCGVEYDTAMKALKSYAASHVAAIDESDAPLYYGQFDYIVENLSYEAAEALAAELMP